MLQRNTYDLTLNITPFLEPWQCLNFISGPIILVFEYCCLVRKKAMMFFCKLGGQALYLHLDVVDMLLICSMLVFMYYLCDFRLCCVFCWYVPLFSLTASTDASWEDRQRGNHDEENMSRANKLRHQHHKLSTWQSPTCSVGDNEWTFSLHPNFIRQPVWLLVLKVLDVIFSGHCQLLHLEHLGLQTTGACWELAEGGGHVRRLHSSQRAAERLHWLDETLHVQRQLHL